MRQESIDTLAKKDMPSREKAQLLQEAVEDRLALDPVLLDLTGQTMMFDYALICSGNSDTHIRAITNAVLEKTDEVNLAAPRVAGQSVGEWVLMDYGDVVLHILSDEARERYKLETFWTTPQPKGALPPSPENLGELYAGSQEITDEGFNDSDEDDFDEDDLDEEDLDDAAFFDEADQEVEPIDEEDLDEEEEEAEPAPKKDGK